MSRRAKLVFFALLFLSLPLLAQQTPPSMVAAYESLADTILAVRAAEAGLVRALLDGHRHAAEALAKSGSWEGVAAEMALFANEGDNAVGGVRKRLLEGGHHFNAAGEEAGIYEDGYVVVTREVKKKVLAMSVSLRQASTDEERQELAGEFQTLAVELLAGE